MEKTMRAPTAKSRATGGRTEGRPSPARHRCKEGVEMPLSSMVTDRPNPISRTSSLPLPWGCLRTPLQDTPISGDGDRIQLTVALRTPAVAGSGAAGEEQDCRDLFFLLKSLVGAESRRRWRLILLRCGRWEAVEELQLGEAGGARSRPAEEPSSDAHGLVLGASWR